MQSFENPIEFEIKETTCYGVESKWGKFNVPIQIDDTTKETLNDLSKIHSTRKCVHGERTLYLKIGGLTGMQKADLLGQGKCYVHVKFQCVGVYTNKESFRYLVLKLTKLRRCEREVEIEVAED